MFFPKFIINILQWPLISSTVRRCNAYFIELHAQREFLVKVIRLDERPFRPPTSLRRWPVWIKAVENDEGFRVSTVSYSETSYRIQLVLLLAAVVWQFTYHPFLRSALFRDYNWCCNLSCNLRWGSCRNCNQRCVAHFTKAKRCSGSCPWGSARLVDRHLAVRLLFLQGEGRWSMTWFTSTIVWLAC
jgi:hypothetical protein